MVKILPVEGHILRNAKTRTINKYLKEVPLNTPVLTDLEKQIRSSFSIDRLLAHFIIPVESHVTKKNNRPIMRTGGGRGKTFIGKSNRLRNAEMHYNIVLRRQAEDQHIEKAFDEPLWIIFHFFIKPEDYFTKKGQVSLTLPDLSNLYQLPEDCLQKSGIIKNDSLIHSHDLSRRLVSDDSRLEIFILKHELDTQWNSRQKI